MYGHNDGMTDMEREMRIAVNEAAIYRLTHKRTNAGLIRAMTNEELTGFLIKVQNETINRFAKFELPNYNTLADCLQQPVE